MPICNSHICMILLVTGGYYTDTGEYWGALYGYQGYFRYCRVIGGIGEYQRILFGSEEYCGVLRGTAGHCWVVLGTARYQWVLGVLGTYWGKEGYCRGTAVYWVVLGAVGGTRGTLGTNRYCGGTSECPGGTEVQRSNKGYWGIQQSTVGYCRMHGNAVPSNLQYSVPFSSSAPCSALVPCSKYPVTCSTL